MARYPGMNILIQQEKSPLVLFLPFPLWERVAERSEAEPGEGSVRAHHYHREVLHHPEARTPRPPRRLRPLGTLRESASAARLATQGRLPIWAL